MGVIDRISPNSSQPNAEKGRRVTLGYTWFFAEFGHQWAKLLTTLWTDHMDVKDALHERISIRAFLDTPVSEGTIHELLDRARYSPSGGNLQPWKVIVLTGAEKDACTEIAGKVLAENPAGEADEYPIYPKGLIEPYRSRRFKVGEDMYELLGIEREDKAARFARMGQNFEFFGAPVAFFFVIDRQMGRGQWAHLGMFMQSIALAAVEMGLGTCMQEAWAMMRKSLHAHFNLPENEVVYCGMAVGHPDPEDPINKFRSDRAPVDEFATFRGF